MKHVETLPAVGPAVTEVHVHKHYVGLYHLIEAYQLVGACSHADFIDQRLQQHVETKENVLVVVDNQNLSFLFHVGGVERNVTLFGCKGKNK